MKLAAKLMFVLLIVVMMLTAVGSYFSVRRAFERFERRQQQLAKDTAAAIDSQVAEAWQQRGTAGVAEATKSLSLHDGKHRVRWVWFERVEADSGTSRTTVVERVLTDHGQSASKMIIDDQGHRHLRTYYPVDFGDGPLGGLEVTGSLDSLDAEARETIALALVSLGAMAVLSFTTVYVVGVRWVARPLDQLIAKTERIGKGDFSDPLPVRGNDELSQLGLALNSMANRLEQQQRQIHDEASERLATLEQLRHADRLKTVGRLAAGMAHELGTPLNVVSGRAGLIASGKLSDDEVVASADTIKSEADRITSIIRQLLAFARPSSTQRTSLDTGELVDETVLLIGPLAEKTNVQVEVEAQSGLMVSGDHGQLQQVLTNLLVNAIQSMPQGGTVRVSVSRSDATRQARDSKLDQDLVAIVISDEGTGISAENREHIFEPFFTTKDVGEGTGLGLSIAYGIVKEHHGWIDVDSEPGRGSCFTVYLPRSIAE